MLLAGITVDLGCFIANSEESSASAAAFDDRFSLFSEIPKLSPSTFSFSSEIGEREAFGNQPVLCNAVAGFRKLLLNPRLFTTGAHFGRRQQTLTRLEELGAAGVQQIILCVNEDEAAALATESVNNLVDGCHAGGIDLRLQFELRDCFTDDCCRIARTVEDRQFTVTLLPVRIRPTRSLPLEEAPPVSRRERVQVVLNAAGNVALRRRTQDEIVDIRAGNACDRPLHELIAAARARW
ncbi:MAG TPA: hypothetical protein VHU83_12695 [Bryobacteraceae bacterium]|jgi:hypothetical protein|nr:hypothetical protein [Bryobacteraceae bacterium]